MAVNIFKAVQNAWGGVKMTHTEIIKNKDSVRNYISNENGKLVDEYGEIIHNIERYVRAGMDMNWKPYREEIHGGGK